MATSKEDLASLLPIVFDIPNDKVQDEGEENLRICGECEYDYNLPLFDYGTDLHNYYIFGILNEFDEFLEAHGWYAEWEDPGTVILGKA